MQVDDQGVAPAEAPAADQDTDASNPAASSPADAGEPNLGDIVNKALGKEAPATSEEQVAKAPVTESQDAGEAKPLPDEPTEDELKDARPRTRERIETLLEQRRDLRGEVEGLKPKAEQWDRIEQFRQEHGLRPEHIANAVQITALVERNPAEALKVLTPLMQSLQQRAGEVLPDDLEQRVRQGEIARQDALRIARAEAARKSGEEERQRSEQQRAERDARAEADRQVETLTQAGNRWDQEQAARDPDWSRKRGMVADIARSLMTTPGREPKSAEEVVRVLTDAAKRVDDMLGQFRQPKPEVPRDPDGVSSRGAKPPAPKDYRDVVDIALGKF